MAHVETCEGTNFIQYIDDPWLSEIEFTEEEILEMKSISDDVDKFRGVSVVEE